MRRFFLTHIGRFCRNAGRLIQPTEFYESRNRRREYLFRYPGFHSQVLSVERHATIDQDPAHFAGRGDFDNRHPSAEVGRAVLMLN
jgi:hypothetical protein